MTLLPCRLLLVLAAGLPGVLAGQTPADTGVAVIRAGRLFDSEAGSFTGPRDIVVRNGRIAEVTANATVPRGARVYDLLAYGEAGLTPAQVLQAATINTPACLVPRGAWA